MAALATEQVLTAAAVHLGLSAKDRADAIDQCGALLRDLGAVADPYLPAMHERERVVSTFIGEEVAIPHGTDAARAHVLTTRLGFLQFPAGVDWGGQRVSICIPIAADGDEHIRLLSTLANVLMDPAKAKALREATDADTVLALLADTGDDAEDETEEDPA